MEDFYYNLTLSNGESVTFSSPKALSSEEIAKIKEEYEKNVKKTGGAVGVTGRVVGETLGGVATGTGKVLSAGKRLDAVVGSWILETLGFDEAAKWSREAQLEASREGWLGGGALTSAGERLKERSVALAPDSTIGEYGGLLGGTIGELTPILLGSLATGGLAAPVALAGAQQFGGKAAQYEQIEFDRLKKQYPNADESSLLAIAAGRAYAPALVSGAKTAGITALGGLLARRAGVWSETGLGGARTAAQKTAEVANQRIWTKMAGGGLVEGLEEAADEGLDVAFEKWKYNPELGHQSYIKSMTKAFLLGGIIGGGISGIGAVSERSRARGVQQVEADELLAMQEDLAAALAPRIEAKWLEKAGLSGFMPTGSFMLGGKRVIPEEARPDWLTEAHEAEVLDISGKQALRKQVALGTLQQDIDEGYAAYLTRPDSKLTESDKRILRRVGEEAEVEMADIETGRREALDPEDRAILDAAGVETVEELYRKTVDEPDPAPTGGIEAATGIEQAVLAPTTRAEVFPPLTRQEGGEGIALAEQETAELDAIRQMEEQAVLKAEMPETFGPKPTPSAPVPTALQALGVNLRKPAPTEVGAEQAPDFTGPSAIAAKPPDVAAPETPGRAAALGRVLKGEKEFVVEGEPTPDIMFGASELAPVAPDVASELDFLKGPPKRTDAEEKAHRKKLAGKVLSREEKGLLKEFEQKRKDWKAASKVEGAPVESKAADPALFAIPAMETTSREKALLRKLEDNPDALLSADELTTLESLQKKAGLPVEKPFKATKKALKKLRNAVRSYRRGRAGTSSLPVDVLTAQMIEHALSVAIKVLEVTGSVKKALDEAYASLDGTSVARGAFDAAMTQRMITALDERVAGNTPEGAMIAATAVDSSIMPDEISKQHQLLLESEDAGIELPPPDSTGGWVRNKREWVWNTGLGRMEDSLEDIGLTQLSMQWNFFEHQVKLLQGKFAGMIFDREGGYNSSKNWFQIWTTVKTGKMKGVETEVEGYVKRRYQWQTKEKDENGKIAVATEPPYEALSPLAKNLVDGMGEAYKKSGDYSRDEVKVFVLDSKGDVELGKFELGETGWPGGMAPEFRSLLDSLDRGSKVTEDIDFLIDRVGRTVNSVKGKKGEEGLNALIDWRQRGRKAAEAKGYTSSENTAQRMSQLEKKRENPMHSDLMSFTVDTFHGYINNWARRIAEIQAFGQSIDPVQKKQDLFDIVISRIESKDMGKDRTDALIREVEKAKAAAYRNPALRGWVGKEGEKAAAAFEAFASLTMLTGVASAIRNGTGTFQTVAGAYYAGNTAAALKGHARFLKAEKLLGLKYAAIDASKLRSWGVLQQDMTHLMTGFEASDAVIQKAMGKINSILRTIRKAQGIALSTTGFKGTEFMVRSISALTAHTLATDAIDANRNNTSPKLVDGFKSFAGDMKNVNVKKILEGDEDAMVDFITRFVTDTQGGYTPNQLPFWMSTPMGKFMGKFMPYGIMMNQFHQKNIARRKNKAFKEAGEDKAARAKVVNGIKKYGAGYFRTYKDLMVMAALFGGGGEAFWQLMALLFGGNRDVPTFSEMASEDNTLPDSMKLVAERWYDNVLFTGTLGAVMELAQPLVSLTGAKGSRAKELTEPAGLAVVKNVWQLTEDLISQETVVDPELVEKYVEKQLSIYRYGKRATARAANALELEWDWARRHEKQQDYYMLRNAGRRYAKKKGIDVDVFFRGGRYLPNPYSRFYEDVKDELYLGNVSEAKQAAMDLAAVMGDDRDRAWSRLSASITGSQPLKVGRYSNTDIQNDFLRWAKRNLPYDDYVRIVNLQQTYEGTAREAGLISGGNAVVMRGMKIDMNQRTPKGRRGKKRDIIKETIGY